MYTAVEMDLFKLEFGLWLLLIIAWRPVLLSFLASVSSFAQWG